ncbi:unnamed protein product [Lactuca saligna]|uniref:Uncharacterized protein n=1 Tax=Lactuca saligna TaxID=75948 RepID=A0AA36E7Q5_LACSI|nr:unnamed protein product [Lactuca saligna]
MKTSDGDFNDKIVEVSMKLQRVDIRDRDVVGEKYLQGFYWTKESSLSLSRSISQAIFFSPAPPLRPGDFIAGLPSHFRRTVVRRSLLLQQGRFCMTKEQMDASGDDDVKVVLLDLSHDDSLSKAGFAHEVVKCIQELREISELEPTYPVEVYFKSLDDDTSASVQILKSQEAYIKEAICSPLLDSTFIPEHAVVIAEKTYRNISNCDFEITLTRQTLTFYDKAILDLYSGNAKYANALKVYLLSRDHFNLKTEFLVGINQIKVDCIEGLPDVDVVLGEHVFLTVGDYYSQTTNNKS